MAASQLKSNVAKTKILIVAHGNEYVEVFSDSRDATVKIVNVPAMHSIQGELLIEELLTLRLPYTWSEVYRNGFLIDRDAIKDISANDLVKRDNDLALIRTMNKIISTQTAMVPS